MPQTYDEHAFLQDMFSIKGATQKSVLNLFNKFDCHVSFSLQL